VPRRTHLLGAQLAVWMPRHEKTNSASRPGRDADGVRWRCRESHPGPRSHPPRSLRAYSRIGSRRPRGSSTARHRPVAEAFALSFQAFATDAGNQPDSSTFPGPPRARQSGERATWLRSQSQVVVGSCVASRLFCEAPGTSARYLRIRRRVESDSPPSFQSTRSTARKRAEGPPERPSPVFHTNPACGFRQSRPGSVPF